MPRPKTIIYADLARKAREAPTGIQDHHLIIKLQAISSSENHHITTVAAILGIGVSLYAIGFWHFVSMDLLGSLKSPKAIVPPSFFSHSGMLCLSG